LLLCRAV